jgi:hypothetical protein
MKSGEYTNLERYGVESVSFIHHHAFCLLPVINTSCNMSPWPRFLISVMFKNLFIILMLDTVQHHRQTNKIVFIGCLKVMKAQHSRVWKGLIHQFLLSDSSTTSNITLEIPRVNSAAWPSDYFQFPPTLVFYLILNLPPLPLADAQWKVF